MIRRPPRSTRTDTLFPYTTLFRTMSVIGTFTPAKDGGWTGSIHTLTINTKLRLVPNDNRDNENAQVFRVFVGQSRVGDAWAARSEEHTSALQSLMRISSAVFCLNKKKLLILTISRYINTNN